jgi:acetolactate synthase-1/2/3 large subunit
VPSRERSGSGFGGRAAVSVLNEVLPPETVLTCDAGENRLFILHDYLVGEGGTVLQPNGGGGMGYAVPAAIAASRVANGRPTVAVCGDGGFAMVLHGLMTAVEIDANVVIVVLDNNALGWVLHGQGDRPFLSELRAFDLAGIASAIGCSAVAVRDQDSFRVALTEALDRPAGVSVVVAQTTLEDTYLDVRTELAAEDVEAVAQ